jgi:methyl-accepting chemotaxis protein
MSSDGIFSDADAVYRINSAKNNEFDQIVDELNSFGEEIKEKIKEAVKSYYNNIKDISDALNVKLSAATTEEDKTLYKSLIDKNDKHVASTASFWSKHFKLD